VTLGTKPDDGQFDEEEALVLEWLLKKPEIIRAVDISLEGRNEEAEPLIVEAIRALLAEDEGHSNGTDGATPSTAAISGGPAEGGDSGGVREGDGEGTSATIGKRLKRGSIGPARCVCIILSGLHGCGKSALCNILKEVLGGTLLSADEIAFKQGASEAGKHSRQAFVTEFRNSLVRGLSCSDQSRYEKLILVDKPNTVRNHRLELLQTFKKLKWKLRGGAIMFVDFTHSADSFGYGADGQLSKRYSEQHISVCLGRVESRGAAHHFLTPSPKLRGILQGAARVAEAPSADELTNFDARVCLDVTKSPLDMASDVLEELCRLGWMGSFLRSASELKPRIEVAWQAYQRVESHWRAGVGVATEPEPSAEWLSQCRRALESERLIEAERRQNVEQARRAQGVAAQVGESTSAASPLYWKIELPEVSKVLTQRGILPSNFIPVENPHTTLLYLGGEGDDATFAKRAGVSVEQFQAMQDALEALQGEVFEVKMRC